VNSRSPDIITQIALVSDYIFFSHKFHCHPHVVNLNSYGDLFRRDYYRLDLLVVRACCLGADFELMIGEPRTLELQI